MLKSLYGCFGYFEDLLAILLHSLKTSLSGSLKLVMFLDNQSAQDEITVLHRHFFPYRQSETNGAGGQQYSGNKPPLISGTPIVVNGGKSELPNSVGGGLENTEKHKVLVGTVSAFYRISFHLFGKCFAC